MQEPFLFGKYSQLSSQNDNKNFCFLQKIEGEIIFSKISQGYALIFYIQESNRLNSFMDTYVENITYNFRYYSLIDMDICSNQSDYNSELKEQLFSEDDILINPTITKGQFYEDILISNSSIVSLVDVEDNVIVFSKLYDSQIFRSLIKKAGKWEEESAIRHMGDIFRRMSLQTIGLKILHRNYKHQAQVLAIYAT